MLTADSAKDVSAKVVGHRSSARVSHTPQPIFAAPLIVQRKCVCGGECPACQDQEEKPDALQTKLRVNSPGDPYEQEADQVMEQVMRMPVHPIRPETTCASADRASRGERELLQSKPIPVQTIPVIQRVADEEEEATAEPEEEAEEETQEEDTEVEQPVLTKTISGARPEVAPKLESQINNLKGRGRSLSKNERNFFEPRFGYDFSQVQVHTDSKANALATAVNALAFTTGTDIVFGSGQYAPETQSGLKLLAHELTHVAQQQGLSATVQPYHLARKPKPKTKPKAKVKPKPKPKPKPKFVCGPNVTSQVTDALSHTKSLFSGWKEKQKEAACNALVTPPEAAFAWDILDLHKNKWILEYRCKHPSSKCPEKPKNPVCATQDANPPCGSTVQVASECYYAGSANYVVFGLMCRLCHDHFSKKGKSFFMGSDLGESDMELLVNLYKAWGLAGANVATAVAWAKAGFHLWPAGGTAPAGDKPNCVPVCPTRYQGRPFRIVWCPFSNPYAECKSQEAALESIIEAIIN